MRASIRPLYLLGDVDDNGVFSGADLAVVDAVYGGSPLPPGVPLARITPYPTLTLSWVNFLHDVFNGLAQPAYAADPVARAASVEVTTAAFNTVIPGTQSIYLWCENAALVLVRGTQTVSSVKLYASDYITVLEQYGTDYWMAPQLGLYGDRHVPEWHAQFSAPAGWSMISITGAVTSVTLLNISDLYAGPPSTGISLAVNEASSWVLPAGSMTFNVPGTVPARYAFTVRSLFKGLAACSFGEGAALPDSVLPPVVTFPISTDDNELSPTLKPFASPMTVVGAAAAVTDPPTDPYENRLVNIYWDQTTLLRLGDFRVHDIFQSVYIEPRAALLQTSYDSLLVYMEKQREEYAYLTMVETTILPVWNAWRNFVQRDDSLELYLYRCDKSSIFAAFDLSNGWRNTVRLSINVSWLEQYPTDARPGLLTALIPWAAFLSYWLAATNQTGRPVPEALARALSYAYDEQPDLLMQEVSVGQEAFHYPWVGYFTDAFYSLSTRIESYGAMLEILFEEELPWILQQPTITQAMVTDRLTVVPDNVFTTVVRSLLACAPLWGYVPITQSTDPISVQRITVPVDVAALCTQVTNQVTTYITTEYDRRDHGGTAATFSPPMELYRRTSITGAYLALHWLQQVVASRGKVGLASGCGGISPVASLLSMLNGNVLDNLKATDLDLLFSTEPATLSEQFLATYKQTFDRLVRAIAYVSTPDHGAALLAMLNAWPDVWLHPETVPTAWIELGGISDLTTSCPSYLQYAQYPQANVPDRGVPSGAVALFTKTITNVASALTLTSDAPVLVTVARRA